MKAETHTPGPWEVFETHSGRGVTPSDASIGDIALCSGHDSRRSRREEMANARLIAAAPDLLESLRDLIGIANALYGKTIMANGQYVIVSDAISQAEAAIAKAEGRA